MNNITTITTIATRPTAPVETPAAAKHRRRIMKVMEKKTFCTLATTSPAGRPHVAGVVYEWANGSLWVHSMSTSRKARSLAANGHGAVTIPFRRMPAGPPFTIHFQARCEVVAMNDPEVRELLAQGELQKISGHGALDEPDGCFLRIRPAGTIHSYGPGAKVLDLIRDPLNHGAGAIPLANFGEQDLSNAS